MSQNKPHTDDLNTAFLVAAQNLAEAAIQRGGAAEAERVGDAWSRGGHLQVSVELPALRVTVLLVEGVDGENSKVLYTAVPDPARTPLPANVPASRLN